MIGYSWIYIVVIAAEILFSHLQHRPVYSWKETVTNFYLSILNGGIDLLIRGGYFLVMTYCFTRRILEVDSQLLYWAGLFVLTDFLFYWMHRMEHFCRLFWAVHITHHSGEHMNLSVGFRASVLQPIYRFVFFLPLALLGFHPADILLMYSLMQFWTVFVHTGYTGRIPVFDWIFVTPSHHRVHHASNIRYLDKNMGMVLILWDRIFGTFQRELDEKTYEPIRYGLLSPLPDNRAATIIMHEWLTIRRDIFSSGVSLRTKLKYLFYPPGWSHDGQRKTSRQLQSAEKGNGKNNI